MSHKAMTDLRRRMADEPSPPAAKIQGQRPSAQVRRNRLRIGLPEYPTEYELRRWRLQRAIAPRRDR